ncbi:UPF0382 membrane protein [Colletotrichum fructicola]|nr:UPF0382 membrane protein [Colletotrichum fructicola]
MTSRLRPLTAGFPAKITITQPDLSSRLLACSVGIRSVAFSERATRSLSPSRPIRSSHQSLMSNNQADETTSLLPTQSPKPDTVGDEEETMSSQLYWKVGAVFGATAVGFGAFGAHGLKNRISDPAKIASWTTAAHYQLAHSIALLIARQNPVAAGFFTAGMTMFSGSIYALILNPDLKFLGPVTPIGGLALIAGWLALAFTKGRVRF